MLVRDRIRKTIKTIKHLAPSADIPNIGGQNMARMRSASDKMCIRDRDVFYETYQVADNYFEQRVRPQLTEEDAVERIRHFFREYAVYNLSLIHISPVVMPSRASAAAFRAESWILPSGLRGNSSKNNTCCGTLKAAALSLSLIHI